MGASQRRKGASGEREAAHAARAYWSAPAAVRAALNGVEAAPDLRLALPRSSIEVKRYASHACLRHMGQARTAAELGELPIVLLREDRDTDWYVLLPMEHSLAFSERLATNRGRPIYPAAREDGE